MTTLLFQSDPYLREFDAFVIRLGKEFVVLDRTCFFPRGGGQVGDTGTISGCKVVNTLKEGEEIHHMIEGGCLLTVGQLVHGVIDWGRRYRIMRLHSAAHLVYYAMREVFGDGCIPASSGLLDDAKDRSDYLFEEPIDREKLTKVAERVNQLIDDGLPITHQVEADSGGRLLWRVESFAAMECGGTHVKNTSEIGRVSIKRGSKPGKGKERIELNLFYENKQ